jgi:hypothetical protein
MPKKERNLLLPGVFAFGAVFWLAVCLGPPPIRDRVLNLVAWLGRVLAIILNI